MLLMCPRQAQQPESTPPAEKASRLAVLPMDIAQRSGQDAPPPPKISWSWDLRSSRAASAARINSKLGGSASVKRSISGPLHRLHRTRASASSRIFARVR
eukprot:5209543-Pleurochrysis_carterae.AAC.1